MAVFHTLINVEIKISTFLLSSVYFSNRSFPYSIMHKDSIPSNQLINYIILNFLEYTPPRPRCAAYMDSFQTNLLR
eukprot:3778983-Ditylum_brightwellii.AAC.1